ncbi:unnamed protein product [Dovyalis caffra]|uniref:Dymeclin n=1 Tax=Dovyalis caffra TaxID=77055 RepID=A0AAV1R3W1_9ROSI|nr:unnamed protein product [Dovyalis caffra]
MGAVPSTPRLSGARPQDTAEYLIGSFVGEKTFPISSDFWQKLLELPLNLHWPTHRVHEACKLFAQNNCYTRHLAKIFIHLSWCLQECVSSSGAPSEVYTKAVNAVYISSVFLKYLIENAQSNSIEELHLSLNESEPAPNDLKTGPTDRNPFIDAAMAQESSLVSLVVRRLLLNYIIRPRIPFNSASYPVFSGGTQPGVLQRVSSAAATFVLLPFNYLVSSTGDGSRNPLADCSLHVLLILNYYHKCVVGEEAMTDRSDDSATSDSISKGKTYFSDNPYCKALENARDIEREIFFSPISFSNCFGMLYVVAILLNSTMLSVDRVDIEGNAPSGSHVRLPFASLFDTLGMFSLYRCLADETAVLLLYTLVHGNSDFLDLDDLVTATVTTNTIMTMIINHVSISILKKAVFSPRPKVTAASRVYFCQLLPGLMPILETLYNASKRTSNHIYILLIILLILSQDSSFNASIHKMVLPSVPWYQEHLLHQTSLGSLTVIILIRTVKYNLSKLRDLYLHTTCLATLANMAPHFHRLSAYASQRLVSLFYMLSRKYNKLAERIDDKVGKSGSLGQESLAEDLSAELHIYTDFLRIVLEILNAILTYALPRNPEVVYAIMHRQEVFEPFKNHPRFNELIENIYMVLDFFNSRIDSQTHDGEWSVEKVLQLIIMNCRSWRTEGMKVKTTLEIRNVYSIAFLIRTRESPRGVLYSIYLAPSYIPLKPNDDEVDQNKFQNTSLNDRRVLLDL